MGGDYAVCDGKTVKYKGAAEEHPTSATVHRMMNAVSMGFCQKPVCSGADDDDCNSEDISQCLSVGMCQAIQRGIDCTRHTCGSLPLGIRRFAQEYNDMATSLFQWSDMSHTPVACNFTFDSHSP